MRTDIYTQEELQELRDLLHALYKESKPLFKKGEWNLLRRFVHQGIRAGAYGKDTHGISQLLLSLHTCRVIQNEIGLRQASMLCVVLYPLAEHDVISRETVLKTFGEDTTHLIECMSRVKSLYAEHDQSLHELTEGAEANTESLSSLEDENFRKLLLSMAEDIRVIICLIADRYVLMQMLNHNPDLAYRHHITEQCRLLYTPMAHRLGLYAIKRELEDMTIKYEDQIGRAHV